MIAGPVRRRACLIVAGQVLHIGVAQLRAGGNAHNDYDIFAEFASTAILLVGPFGLCRARPRRRSPAGAIR